MIQNKKSVTTSCQYTAFFMRCRENFGENNTSAMCNNIDCACQYHVFCVDKLMIDNNRCRKCEKTQFV